MSCSCFFFFQAEDGIRDYKVTGVQTCALPICNSELILRAHLPEVNAAIFDSQAAAATVVTELNDLVLQCFVLKVVADTSDEIKPLAGFASVADEPANLVGIWLLEDRKHRRTLQSRIAERRIVIQAEIGNSGKE